MTDRPQDAEPPRARYGEFASPQEQERARGHVLPEAGSLTPREMQPSPAAAQRRPPAHPVDRVITLVLLAIGLILIINSIPGYLALSDVMQSVYESLNAGTYSATETAAGLGAAALIIQGMLWVATTGFSVLAIRRGRLSWWIPLVGGAISFIAMMIIVSVALFADPGFIDSVNPENLPRA